MITILASKIGLEHPIVGLRVVESYIEKIENSKLHSLMLLATDFERNYGVLQCNVELFCDFIIEFTMSDDPMQLLESEIMVAQHQDDSTLFAFAYHDTYN